MHKKYFFCQKYISSNDAKRKKVTKVNKSSNKLFIHVYY